jgi:hypothetical protein
LPLSRSVLFFSTNRLKNMVLLLTNSRQLRIVAIERTEGLKLALAARIGFLTSSKFFNLDKCGSHRRAGSLHRPVSLFVLLDCISGPKDKVRPQSIAGTLKRKRLLLCRASGEPVLFEGYMLQHERASWLADRYRSSCGLQPLQLITNHSSRL